MSGVPDLGPPPERVTVHIGQVRRLIGDQFPRWAGLPVRPVAQGGWDNFTFHLGDTMVARLPSAAEYALAVGKEQRWLPVLAPQLPLPVPVPLAHGRPGMDYPSRGRSILGFPANPRASSGFRTRSRSPSPWPSSWPPCGTLTPTALPGRESTTGSGARRCAPTTRRPGALAALDGHLDAGPADEIWQAALAAPWDGTDVWFHGVSNADPEN